MGAGPLAPPDQGRGQQTQTLCRDRREARHQAHRLSILETWRVHRYVPGMEEEGLGEIENVLLWFLTSKQVWCLLHLIDKILRRHVMDKRISINPKVCHRQACIKKTRFLFTR